MKKLLLGTVAVLALAAIAVLVATFAVSERGGEVVALRTTGADGKVVETHLWVVDADGAAWLRAGDPKSGWLLRLRERPEVEVVRGGATLAVRAVPVPEKRDEINRLMREKYGRADRFIDALFSRADATPVRLDPR